MCVCVRIENRLSWKTRSASLQQALRSDGWTDRCPETIGSNVLHMFCAVFTTHLPDSIVLAATELVPVKGA